MHGGHGLSKSSAAFRMGSLSRNAMKRHWLVGLKELGCDCEYITLLT